MTREIDKFLEDMATDIGSSLSKDVPSHATYQQEPVGQAVDRLQALGSELRARMRNQRMVSQHTYEAKCADVTRQFEYDMNETITRLELERDHKLRILRDEFAREMHEIDAAANRLP